MQSTTASRISDNSIVLIWRSSFESLTRRRSGATQKALEYYIRRRRRQCLGVVPNQPPYIYPVTYLHRSTNSEQLLSMFPDRSSLPRSSRLLINNISQKCSWDDRQMTLGGLHGHGVVHSSEVGPSMVPRGHVTHHQQRCRAQQQVVPTISRWS